MPFICFGWIDIDNVYGTLCAQQQFLLNNKSRNIEKTTANDRVFIVLMIFPLFPNDSCVFFSSLFRCDYKGTVFDIKLNIWRILALTHEIFRCLWILFKKKHHEFIWFANLLLSAFISWSNGKMNKQREKFALQFPLKCSKSQNVQLKLKQATTPRKLKLYRNFVHKNYFDVLLWNISRSKYNAYEIKHEGKKYFQLQERRFKETKRKKNIS